jgi:hypothetical protein
MLQIFNCLILVWFQKKFKELKLGFDFGFLALSPIPLLVPILEPKK